MNPNVYLNPLTLESHLFLQTLEKCGKKYTAFDEQLLSTMDKLVDAINNFYDQCKTKIEDSDDLKVVKIIEVAPYIAHAYTCVKCHKYLGPSTEKVARHIKQKHCMAPPPVEAPPVLTRKQRLEMRQPEMQLPKRARELLSQKIGKLLREPVLVAMSLKWLKTYNVIENDILKVVQPLYPNDTVKIYSFGSRISGIGDQNSDLDLFVDIGGTFNTFELRAFSKTIDAVIDVSESLMNDAKWDMIRPITNARVPIIKLLHVESDMLCDIGFSNSLGYCNTLLMEYYFELQPIASRMCLYLKRWLECVNLKEYVTTYSLTLMVIFFLQTKKLLPTVKELQTNLDEEILIGPWVSNFKKLTPAERELIPAIEPSRAAVRDYLGMFFQYIADFNFGTFIMCTYYGRAIKTSDLNEELPKHYLTFISQNGPEAELQTEKYCVVQDPLQLNHNVTHSITSTLLYMLQQFCKESTIIREETNTEIV